ncbi:hypothetical protein CYMTET_48937 [Cymbomonas tetramitiformis]|uniref:Amidase domain-containing protein n=1 Tax=Cymbomonas tetramitiformis TaxID=36881 RepID=A0AAE0EV81_9CHLO|nr:hypothetical protein CYMTET_48937 [Cymbomonas tetramitiformis]
MRALRCSEDISEGSEKGFGAEVKRRILMGTYTLSAGYYDAYYTRAQQVRTLVRAEISEALKDCVALLSPVAPTPAYPLNSKVSDPLAMYVGDLMTVNVNLAGLPAISLPCGFTDSGNSSYPSLPVGVQLIGGAFKEVELLSLAHTFEKTFPITNAPKLQL